MHTTNYVNTLTTVSPDTKSAAATATPTGEASVAELQAGRECLVGPTRRGVTQSLKQTE